MVSRLFRGLIFSHSNETTTPSLRSRVVPMIEERGGTFSPLSVFTTHLLCLDPLGPPAATSHLFHLSLVDHIWVSAAVSAGLLGEGAVVPGGEGLLLLPGQQQQQQQQDQQDQQQQDHLQQQQQHQQPLEQLPVAVKILGCPGPAGRLRGVRLAVVGVGLAGLGASVAAEGGEMVEWPAGRELATHILVLDALESGCMEVVVAEPARAVSLAWLRNSIANGSPVPVESDPLNLPWPTMPAPRAQGLLFCQSGFEKIERLAVAAVLWRLGLPMTPHLSPANTHLVAGTDSSCKYIRAIEWGKTLVDLASLRGILAAHHVELKRHIRDRIVEQGIERVKALLGGGGVSLQGLAEAEQEIHRLLEVKL